MTSSQSLSEFRYSPARKYAVARLFQPSAKPGLSSMMRVNVAIASGKRCSPISATPLLNSSSTRASPDRLQTAHDREAECAAPALVRVGFLESRERLGPRRRLRLRRGRHRGHQARDGENQKHQPFHCDLLELHRNKLPCLMVYRASAQL